MNYATGIQNSPPQTAALMEQVRRFQSPYQFNANHADVMAGLTHKTAVNLDRYSQRMQDAYAQQQQRAEMQAALAGLQQLSQDRQNQNNLANSRLSAMLGFQGQLLDGLLR